jgi:hypothetical protein
LSAGVRIGAVLVTLGLNSAVNQLTVITNHLGSEVETKIRVLAKVFDTQFLPRVRPFPGMFSHEAVGGPRTYAKPPTINIMIAQVPEKSALKPKLAPVF